MVSEWRRIRHYVNGCSAGGVTRGRAPQVPCGNARSVALFVARGHMHRPQPLRRRYPSGCAAFVPNDWWRWRQQRQPHSVAPPPKPDHARGGHTTFKRLRPPLGCSIDGREIGLGRLPDRGIRALVDPALDLNRSHRLEAARMYVSIIPKVERKMGSAQDDYRHRASTLRVISSDAGGFSPSPRECSISWMRAASMSR